MTFMNLSGQAIGAVLKKKGIEKKAYLTYHFLKVKEKEYMAWVSGDITFTVERK